MATKKQPPRGPQMELAADLAVAFVNTAGARPKNRQIGVESYGELVAWGLQTGILSALEAEGLRRRAAEAPAEARAVFERAAALRATIARLFNAVMTEKPLPDKDLAALNDALSAALPALRLVPGEAGAAWGWAGDAGALDRMLWPVVRSAAELLASTGGHPEVRQCGAPDCRLYFIDRDPARRRRWCDMKTCGNRIKALRYYYRKGRGQRDSQNRRTGLWRRQRPRARPGASQVLPDEEGS